LPNSVLYGKSFTKSEGVYGIRFTNIKVIREKVYTQFYSYGFSFTCDGSKSRGCDLLILDYGLVAGYSDRSYNEVLGYCKHL